MKLVKDEVKRAKAKKKVGRKPKKKYKPQAMVIRDENGRWVKGADVHRQYSQEDIFNAFLDAIDRLYDEDDNGEAKYLSLQEVVRDMPFSWMSYHLYVKKYKECKAWSEEIKAGLNSIIARGSLTGKYHPTASIWRHKQLGEVDRQVIESEVKEQPLFSKGLPSGEKKSLPEGKDSEYEDEDS